MSVSAPGANTVLDATYRLNFEDAGLSRATALDKQLRDSVTKTAATYGVAGKQVTVNTTQIAGSQQRLRDSVVKTSESWQLAARAAMTASRQLTTAQAAIDTRVRKSTEEIVASSRAQGESYSEIIDKLRQLRTANGEYAVSADEATAAVTRNSKEQVEAIQRQVEARNRLRHAIGLQATETGRRGGKSIESEEERGAEKGLVGGFSERARMAAGYIGTGLFGALAGYATASGIKSSIDQTQQLVEETQQLSQATGLSTKAASEWIEVAQSRGVSASQLGVALKQLGNSAETSMTDVGKASDSGLKKLASRASEAEGGSKAAQKEFASLGITAQQVSRDMNNLPALDKLVSQRLLTTSTANRMTLGNDLLGSTSQSTQKAIQAYHDLGISQRELAGDSHNVAGLFDTVIDRLNKMQPGVEKTSVETALFGRSYQDMSEIIAGGSKNFDAATKSAQKYGASLSGDSGEKLKQLAESQHSTALEAEGLGVQLAEHLAPAVIGLERDGIGLTETLLKKLSPVVVSITHDLKDTADWFGRNKTVLDGLLITAGSIGGLIVLSKTLQTIGGVARGTMKEFRTAKTTVQALAHPIDLLRGNTSEEMSAEEKANAEHKATIDLLGKMSAAYDGAATSAGRMAEAQGLGGGVSGIGGETRAVAAAEEGEAQTASGLILPRGVEAPGATRIASAGAAELGEEAGVLGGAAGAAGLAAQVESDAKSGGIMQALFGKTGASSLTESLGGAASKLGEAGFMGMLGYGGGKAIGGLVGGRTGGQWGSMVGAGAAAGMAIGPEGALAGAALGAGVEGIKKLIDMPSSQQKQVQGIQSQMRKALSAGDVGELSQLSKQADEVASHFKKMGDETHTVMTRFGEETTKGPDLSKQISELSKLSSAASSAASNLKSSRIDDFAQQLASIKLPDAGNMVASFSQEFAGASPMMRDAAAKATLQVAQGFEQEGKLPAGAVKDMIGAMEAQFPGLGSYLHQQGLSTSREFTTSFSLDQAKSNLSGALTSMATEFGRTRKQMGADGSNIVADAVTMGAQLQTAMSTGTAQTRAVADKEFSGLQSDVQGYLQQMQSNTSSQIATVASQVQAGSMSAATEGGQAFQGFEQQVKAAMNGGVISVQTGLKLINQETVQALQQLGVSGKTASKLASQGWSVGEIAQSQAGAKFVAPIIKNVGGWVPGDPNRDGVPAMLSGHEFVMTGHGQSMMESYAPGLLHMIAGAQLPNFAKGGFVDPMGAGGNGGGSNFKVPVVKGSGVVATDAQGNIDIAAQAAERAINRAQSRAGGGGGGGDVNFSNVSGQGGSALQNEELGRRMMLAAGWGANQWPFLQKLWMKESGWSSTVMHNPSMPWLANGNASGIPQADGHGNVYAKGDARAQIAWGLRDIRGTYGSPQRAWAHEVAFNWYRAGGFTSDVSPGSVNAATHSWAGVGETPAEKRKAAASKPTGLEGPTTIPGTGVNGIPARQEFYWASDASPTGISSYRGLPVLSWNAYNDQRAVYQRSKHTTTHSSSTKAKRALADRLTWRTVGAMVDTQGVGAQAGGPANYHGGMSYSEYLETGANKGMRPDLLALLGLNGTQTGMRYGQELYFRMPGRANATHYAEGWKSDIGSGRRGDRSVKVGLHPELARSIGFHGGNVQVAAASGSTMGAGERKVTRWVPRGPGITGDAFLSAFDYYSQPTPTSASSQGTGMLGLLQQAVLGATLKPQTQTELLSATTQSAGTLGAAGGSLQLRGAGRLTSRVGRVAQRMVNEANRINGMPYVYGGGHNSSFSPARGSSGLGYDCSGAVSAVLHAGGLLSSPLTAGTDASVMGWGLPGNGRYVTVGTRGTSGDSGHMMMKFFGNYLESGGGGPLGKPSVHQDSGWDGVFPVHRHPRGFRAGGFVRGDRNEADVLRAKRRGMREGGSVRRPVLRGLPASSALPTRTTGTSMLAGQRYLQGIQPQDRSSWSLTSGNLLVPTSGSVKSVTGAVRLMATQTVTLGTNATNAAIVNTSSQIKSAIKTLRVGGSRQQITRALGGLERALSDTNTESYSSLLRTQKQLQAELASLPKGDAHDADRLRQALKLTQAAEGKRVGLLVASATEETTAIQNAQSALQNLMNRENVSSTSAQGTKMLERYQDQVVKTQRDTVAKLETAYKAALRAGDKSAAGEIKGQLTTALQGLDQALGDRAQARVAALEAAAQQSVDTATHNATMASGRTSQLDAGLEGSSAFGGYATGAQTVAGGQALASSYTAQAGSIAGEIAALQGQEATAKRVGDKTLADQVAESIQSAQGDYQAAMLSATQAIKAGVEGQAQAITDMAQHGVNMASGAVSNLQTSLTGLGGAQDLTQTVAGGQELASAYYAEMAQNQNLLGAQQSQQGAALSVGDQALADQIAEAIQQTQGQIQQDQLSALQAIRAGVEGQAAQAVSDATHQVNLATTGEQTLQLQQQLANDQNTPGSQAAYAAYIRQTVIPALQAEMGTLQQQLVAAQSQGDTNLAQQVAEAIAGQQNTILQAQLDAQQAIQSNTQQTAENTAGLSGQLGVSFENDSFPDLGGMLNGV